MLRGGTAANPVPCEEEQRERKGDGGEWGGALQEN